MFSKSVLLTGIFMVGACAVNAQTYWSSDPNLNCTGFGDANGKPMHLTAGGYVCYIYGTLPWYAAGSIWSSSIRVSAPSTAPVAFFLNFADESGADATLDFQYVGDSAMFSDTSASQALFANQPLQVDLLGVHSQAPDYAAQAGGSVVVLAECPDANTCSQVQAQLIYSALPSQPWSLSAPVVWDDQTSLAWSAVGVDGGLANSSDQVSFVIYNLDSVGKVPHSYTINLFDLDGKPAGSAVTKAVPLYGTYGDLLRNVIAPPAGPFKMQVVSPTGDAYTAFEALQFHGTSATTLVSATESLPAAAALTNGAARVNRGGRNRHPSPAAMPQVRPHISQ